MAEHGFEDNSSLHDDTPVSMKLDNGAVIEVWAAQQGEKNIKLRIHVHAPDGTLFKQEEEDIKDGSTLKKARDHGIDRAKRIAGGAFGAPHDDHHQATPI
jgi:hypothetical protein